MSCTIYYKGRLKENVSIHHVAEIVFTHTKDMNVDVENSDNEICINFHTEMCEPLIFSFKDGKIDEFCKWNGEDAEEFYKILAIFFDLRPLFRSLQVDDDNGLWNMYVAQRKPCKIKLIPLPPEGELLLTRMRNNERRMPTATEEYILRRTGLSPHHDALLRIIVQDFIQIMDIRCIEDFKPQSVLDLVEKLNFWEGKIKGELDPRSFDFDFPYQLMEIWMGYTFSYKNAGLLKDHPTAVKGLFTSKLAGVYRILSIFLNRHAGGPQNEKEAQMVLFAKKYYRTRRLGEVMVIDTPDRELAMLFSMLHYLGFSYHGV